MIRVSSYRPRQCKKLLIENQYQYVVIGDGTALVVNIQAQTSLWSSLRKLLPARLLENTQSHLRGCHIDDGIAACKRKQDIE